MITASRIIRSVGSALGFCLILFLGNCREDNLRSSNISIAMYPENKPAAISFTFDDGWPSCYTIIAPLFTKFNYRASFYVIVGNIRDEQSWSIWRNLSHQGFEIGNHSFTHLNLKNIYDTAVLKVEIIRSYEILKENIGKAPFAFVHPYHGSNPVANALIFTKHYATRLAPDNFSSWEAWSGTMTEEYVKRKIRETISNGLWYVACAHAIGEGYGPITERLLTNILEYVKENESKIHLDTFENLAKYKIERENTQLIISENGSGKVVELRSSLDPEIFDLPLCVVIHGQGNSRSLKVSALKGSVSFKSNGMDMLMYVRPTSIVVVN